MQPACLSLTVQTPHQAPQVQQTGGRGLAALPLALHHGTPSPKPRGLAGKPQMPPALSLPLWDLCPHLEYQAAT